VLASGWVYRSRCSTAPGKLAIKLGDAQLLSEARVFLAAMGHKELSRELEDAERTGVVNFDED
jgi:hypothetical protein